MLQHFFSCRKKVKQPKKTRSSTLYWNITYPVQNIYHPCTSFFTRDASLSVNHKWGGWWHNFFSWIFQKMNIGISTWRIKLRKMFRAQNMWKYRVKNSLFSNFLSLYFTRNIWISEYSKKLAVFLVFSSWSSKKYCIFAYGRYTFISITFFSNNFKFIHIQMFEGNYEISHQIKFFETAKRKIYF